MAPRARKGLRANGSARRMGHAAVTPQDAGEFELEGLISEHEDRNVDGSSEPSEDSGTGIMKEARHRSVHV